MPLWLKLTPLRGSHNGFHNATFKNLLVWNYKAQSFHCDLWPFLQVSDPGPFGPSCLYMYIFCIQNATEEGSKQTGEEQQTTDRDSAISVVVGSPFKGSGNCDFLGASIYIRYKYTIQPLIPRRGVPATYLHRECDVRSLCSCHVLPKC